jgi:hypothetical protein
MVPCFSGPASIVYNESGSRGDEDDVDSAPEDDFNAGPSRSRLASRGQSPASFASGGAYASKTGSAVEFPRVDSIMGSPNPEATRGFEREKSISRGLPTSSSTPLTDADRGRSRRESEREAAPITAKDKGKERERTTSFADRSVPAHSRTTSTTSKIGEALTDVWGGTKPSPSASPLIESIRPSQSTPAKVATPKIDASKPITPKEKTREPTRLGDRIAAAERAAGITMITDPSQVDVSLLLAAAKNEPSPSLAPGTWASTTSPIDNAAFNFGATGIETKADKAVEETLPESRKTKKKGDKSTSKLASKAASAAPTPGVITPNLPKERSPSNDWAKLNTTASTMDPVTVAFADTSATSGHVISDALKATEDIQQKNHGLGGAEASSANATTWGNPTEDAQYTFGVDEPQKEEGGWGTADALSNNAEFTWDTPVGSAQQTFVLDEPQGGLGAAETSSTNADTTWGMPTGSARDMSAPDETTKNKGDSGAAESSIKTAEDKLAETAQDTSSPKESKKKKGARGAADNLSTTANTSLDKPSEVAQDMSAPKGPKKKKGARGAAEISSTNADTWDNPAGNAQDTFVDETQNMEGGGAAKTPLANADAVWDKLAENTHDTLPPITTSTVNPDSFWNDMMGDNSQTQPSSWEGFGGGGGWEQKGSADVAGPTVGEAEMYATHDHSGAAGDSWATDHLSGPTASGAHTSPSHRMTDLSAVIGLGPPSPKVKTPHNSKPSSPKHTIDSLAPESDANKAAASNEQTPITPTAVDPPPVEDPKPVEDDTLGPNGKPLTGKQKTALKKKKEKEAREKADKEIQEQLEKELAEEANAGIDDWNVIGGDEVNPDEKDNKPDGEKKADENKETKADENKEEKKDEEEKEDWGLPVKKGKKKKGKK